MNAEIIAVGSELLLGQIANTNAQFLSQQLAQLGINVYYHTVVGDNEKRLQKALEVAKDRANLIILTGGLGPTKDDLTKESVARQLKLPLITNDDSLAIIEDFFKRTKREMTNNNRKQAQVIEGSIILKNDNGMAPGMLIKNNDHHYMLLPGPPHELKKMFLTYGKAELARQIGFNEKIVSRVLRFFGIGEALLETKIESLIDKQTNPTIAILAADGEVTVRLTAKHSDELMAEQLLNKVEQEILAEIGEFFYGYNETTLMKELAKKLTEHKLTISSAESLTGGMFQQQLTAIPGSGAVFKGGLVTYCNEAKQTVLNVSEETLASVGAVSEQCAREMADNVRKLLNTHIGISFTGVAGPDKLEGEQVGTVYVGISVKNKETLVYKLNLGTDRNTNRIRSVSYGCYYLLQQL